MCARYIHTLFHCPGRPLPSSSGTAPLDLPHFIAYALHRTRLTSSVTFAALYLLQRLRPQFIAARSSSGHRLFLSDCQKADFRLDLHSQPPTSNHSRRPARPPSFLALVSPLTLPFLHDKFYGHEPAARMCSRYIHTLFHRPDQPPPPPSYTPMDPPRFIAYALHHTRLTPSVTFAALYLLQRLKTRFIAVHGSSGHRLLISAFMIASKVICDDTYSNKSWCIVGQRSGRSTRWSARLLLPGVAA